MTSRQRLNIGERKGSSHSDRLGKSKLFIVKKDCPKCGHDKCLESEHVSKCSRCKYDYR